MHARLTSIQLQPGMTDRWGSERSGFSARTVIVRRDFGLTWNQAFEAGAVMVGNDVRISIELEAVRQA